MKKDKLPKPISILILTLLTTTVWISLSVYRAITVEPAPSVPQNVVKSLTPTLNKESINKIESSIFLNDSEIPQTETQSSAPSPTVVPTEIASPSASPSASPI
jgi:hypothetical protein